MEQITETVEVVQQAADGDVVLKTLEDLKNLEAKTEGEEVAVQVADDVDGTPVTVH